MAKLEFMHYRPAPYSGATSHGATVAIYPKADTRTVLISVARCGPTDNFSKKVGRAVASGRIAAFLAGNKAMNAYVREVAVADVEDVGIVKDTVAGFLDSDMDELGLE